MPSLEVTLHSLSDPNTQREYERTGSPQTPLDFLIALEEELGCSIVEACRRERDRKNAERTFNAH